MNVPIQPMPVAFKLIRAVEASDFEKQINALLEKGWVFHGPMSVENGHLFQALIQIEVQPVKLGKALEMSVASAPIIPPDGGFRR